MNKGSVFRLLLGFCLLTFLAGTAVVGTTIMSPHQAAASHATCRTTQVTLHGKASPSISCLDGHKGAVRTRIVRGDGPLAQLSFQDSCVDDALALYWNSPVNSIGPELCINGSGGFNLNENFNGLNWNDQASAWWTGCYNVLFFQDINDQGAVAEAQGSYDGKVPHLGTFRMEKSAMINFPPSTSLAPMEEMIAPHKC